MQETKQVGVVDLPEVDPSPKQFYDRTVELLVVARGCVIGGARVTRGISERLVECWGVSDLVADHWWPLAAPEASLVELTTPGTSAAVRGALERAAKAWGVQVQEALGAVKENTAGLRTAAHEAGRRQGTAEVVGCLVDRLEKNAAQGVVDQLGRQRQR